MKKRYLLLILLIAALILIPAVTALLDNRWEDKLLDQTMRVVDRRPPNQFDTFPRTCYKNTYTTWIFSPTAKDLTISYGMCLGGNHPTGTEGVFLNGEKLCGNRNCNDDLIIPLKAGLNKLWIKNVGDCHTHAECHSTFKYEEGSTRISEQVDYMDSKGKFCDPATNDCCTADSKFKPKDSQCDLLPDGNYSGFCSGIGTCINLDNSPEECRPAWGEPPRDAWLSNGGDNRCCGDDAYDCGVYNQGKICFPGEGWKDPLVGEIMPHPCRESKPGVNVVLGEDFYYQCLTGKGGLDHSFTLDLNYFIGNNLWTSDTGRSMIDELDLDLSYRANTRRGMQTYFYLAKPTQIKFNVTCDSGNFRHVFVDQQHIVAQGPRFDYRSFISPQNTRWTVAIEDGNEETFGGNESVEISSDLQEGWHDLEIWCGNDDSTDDESVYPQAGLSLITINPLFSTLVSAMASHTLDLTLMKRHEVATLKLQERAENLSSLSNLFPGLGDLGEISFFDQETTEAQHGLLYISTIDENVLVSFSHEELIDSTIDPTDIVKANFTGIERPQNDFNTTQIMIDGETHMFICAQAVGENKRNIGECFGDSAPFSSGAYGYQNIIGDAFDTGEGHMYCTEQMSWEYNLDDPLFERACRNAEDPDGSKLIEKILKFGWTGTRCCSEQQDRPIVDVYEGETYNDPDEPDTRAGEGGACYQSLKVDNGVKPFEDSERVIIHQGQFVGCNLQPGGEFTDMVDDEGNTLVESYATCTVLDKVSGIPGNNYYCSYTDDWRFTPQTGDRIVKQRLEGSPFDDAPQDCCLPDECFDGQRCIANQVNDSTSITTEGFRCFNGGWIEQTPKYNWNFQMTGFCPRPEDCLVNPQGLSDKNYLPETYYLGPEYSPACIADGQHISQYQCVEGHWTSRTKYIGLQLLDYAEIFHPGDYELFCDDYDKVLNFVGYKALPNALAVENYIENAQCFDQKCLNQVCVLKYEGNKVAFGASLNAPINDISKSFLLALGELQTTCNDAINDDGDFDRCGESHVWYNHDLNSVIYLPEDVLESRDYKQLQALRWSELAADAMQEIVDFVYSREQVIQLPTDFVNRTHLFEKLYLINLENRKYFGFVETDQSHIGLFASDGTPTPVPVSYIGLNYKNFEAGLGAGSDVCALIKGLDPTFTGVCHYDPTTKQLILLRVSLSATANPTLQAWADLTSKLRFKEKSEES